MAVSAGGDAEPGGFRVAVICGAQPLEAQGEQEWLCHWNGKQRREGVKSGMLAVPVSPTKDKQEERKR